VIFQNTGQPMAANAIMTATFQLGNSSAVRRRVTVLMQESDFSDLTACTFWLAPFQALATYTMRGFTTKAWTNATLSIYAASVGSETWTQVDNVTFERTPATAIGGTECVEPAAQPLVEPGPALPFHGLQMKPVIARGLLIGCMSFLMTACNSRLECDETMGGNEVSAIMSLKTIANAQAAYSSDCGNGGYTTSLRVLGEPPPGGTKAYLDPSLTQSENPEKRGYRFTLSAGAKSKAGPKDCHGHPTGQTFYATATPLKFYETGTRSFAMNQDVTVWMNGSSAAPIEPFSWPAVPVQ
jgi:hypothetical protein